MNQKKNKRALLSSAVSLLLCFAMLLGATFAWFTDSVVSGSNVIKTGKLDIVVDYTLGDKDENGDLVWKTLDGADDLFEKDLWEPGHTEVVALRVQNTGNLALKYAANMNILDETVGKTADGANIVLSDILTVSTLTIEAAGVDPVLGIDIAAMTLEKAFESEDGIGWGDPVAFRAGNVLEADQSLYVGKTQYVFVKVDMPETVGNEANYAADNAPSIELGINVLAAQYTYEKDSFGDQYDKDAEYPIVYDYKVKTLEGLKEAFAAGGNVLLEDDIEFEKITPVEPGVEVYLNLNGKTITVDQETKSNTLIWVKEGAKLTIDGNGTIDLGGVSTMAIFCPYGELVIENGTFIRDKVTTVTNATTGLFMGAKSKGCNVTINGGYFDAGYYDENAADIEGILNGTVQFNETDTANRGKPADADLVRVAIKDNVSVVLNHSGYGSFKVYGGTFVGANPAWGDEGCMLPTTPNYLRPWSYYQGALLDGQTFDENGIVLPDGYTITKGVTEDGIPVYTVEYSK